MLIFDDTKDKPLEASTEQESSNTSGELVTKKTTSVERSIGFEVLVIIGDVLRTVIPVLGVAALALMLMFGVGSSINDKAQEIADMIVTDSDVAKTSPEDDPSTGGTVDTKLLLPLLGAN